MTQRILYPCYFNAKLSRKEGRRVAKTAAVCDMNRAALSRAVRAAGLIPVEETKNHPSRWFTSEGRVLVEFAGSKEELLKKIADKL